MMTNEQSERIQNLRAEYERTELAYQEFDMILDHIKNTCPVKFSREAREHVLEGLGRMTVRAKNYRDVVGAQLKEQEGWRR